MKSSARVILTVAGLLCAAPLAAQDEQVTLSEAVASGLAQSPEVGVAAYAREAAEAELREARAAFWPSISSEVSAGARRLENNTRRNLGIASDWLYPIEGYSEGDITLYDFGRRSGTVEQRRALAAAAGAQIDQRAEDAALEIARQYLEVSLQKDVAEIAEANVAVHQSLLDKMEFGVERGVIGLPEQQLAQQRLQTANVRRIEAEQALQDARTALQRLAGINVTNIAPPPELSRLSESFADSVIAMNEETIDNDPAVLAARAEARAAIAAADAAKGELYPTIGADVAARAGKDIDGFRGETNDFRGRVYLRWNLFDGGQRKSRYEAALSRASEAQERVRGVVRDTGLEVEQALNAFRSLKSIETAYRDEAEASAGLLNSYEAQFDIGRRSLFDLLEAQDTVFMSRIRYANTYHARLLSGYRLLAARQRFLDELGVDESLVGSAVGPYGPE